MTQPLHSIVVKLDAGVCEIVIDRAPKKNAMTRRMYTAMADAVQHASEDPQARVILIRGAHDVFSAGNDMDDFMFTAGQESKEAAVEHPFGSLVHALITCTKPVLAAVRGAAIGMGSTILPLCDLVYAGDDAHFQMPFTQLGLCPEAGSSFLLPAQCGYRAAAEKLFFAEAFDAQEALRIGLINQVLPADQVVAHAKERALTLAKLPQSAILATKRLLREPQLEALRAVIQKEVTELAPLLHGPALREAVTAFFQKRPPDFSAC